MGTRRCCATVSSLRLSVRREERTVARNYGNENLLSIAPIFFREQSTSISFEELEVEGLDETTRRLSAAASISSSHKEDWMVNLGRGKNNEWLSQQRSEEWYTGVPPSSCPGTDVHGNLRSLPLPNLSAVTRKATKEYFDNSWTLFEMLFAGLKGEEPFYRPPVHGLRHPQVFYYGHTPCLYINKLRVAGVLSKPVNAYFESIFEVGVDEMIWDDMQKNDMYWPAISEIYDYRKEVYDTVVNAIMTHPSLDDSDGPLVVDQQHPMWALFMGFEHERIHFETSSVLFRETPFHLVQQPKNWPPLHPTASEQTVRSHPVETVNYPTNRMVPVEEDSVDLGKPPSFPSFGWDNEYGERHVKVPPFEASEHMITNGAFWHFVAGGSYSNREHWCDDGWEWRKHRNLKCPFFWQAAGPAGSHEYTLRTIFNVISMPWDWPVDVTYYEAKAFCRWKESNEKKCFRVLTEAEHHVIRHKDHNLSAARSDVFADKVMVTSGESFGKGSTGANLNLAFSSQNPVGWYPPSHTGHYDTTGNAWEWTEDHFNPLKGFEVHHVYDDFSAPCFDGKHSVIVGGSFMSTGDEASVFARFHFRPHFLQHSGFRLVASDYDAPSTQLNSGNFEGQSAARDATELTEETLDVATDSENVYESTESLNMYLGMHYPSSGSEEGMNAIIPHSMAPEHGLRFPQRAARLLADLNPEKTNGAALDVGCAVGGSSFELAKVFDLVDAFDFSDSFVSAAKQMQSSESVKFPVRVEADIFKEVSAVHEEGVTSEVLDKVNFFTGDACKISQMATDETLGTYDGVVMANLLCRLPDPVACLTALPHIVNKGGVVVIVTPFSWLEEFTHPSKWLGGFCDPVSGEPLHSRDQLENIMVAGGFEKIHCEEMPVVIREHQRKYQYIVSEATGWRKK